MHPDLFSTFVDIGGDMGPDAGTKDQTIARLYGGNAAAWAVYDPTKVITKHGAYHDIAGWFAISSDAPQQDKGGFGNPGGTGLGGQDAAGMPNDQTDAANALCKLGRANGIACAVVTQPGRHDWPLAADVFTTSLPWLAGRIGTPGSADDPLARPGRRAGGHAGAGRDPLRRYDFAAGCPLACTEPRRRFFDGTGSVAAGSSRYRRNIPAILAAWYPSTNAPDRSVPDASGPATGSVRSDTTKKQSMVGDGRKLPNVTRPLRPGSASSLRRRPADEVDRRDMLPRRGANVLDVLVQAAGFDIDRGPVDRVRPWTPRGHRDLAPSRERYRRCTPDHGNSPSDANARPL